MTIENAAVAPGLPKISMKICRTGCPASESIVVAKSWMQKRMETRTKKPKTAEAPTDMTTPSGALRAAFVVSSLICEEASNPVLCRKEKVLGFFRSSERRDRDAQCVLCD